MAEKTGQFKGIKQVLKETYDNAADKAGYLWFVRPTADAQSGDIYFGTRHYGRFDDNEVPKSGTDIKVTNGKIDVALSEDITVAGLNDTYGCGLIKNGNTIKAGTSLMDIMKQMLSKEINPKAATKPSISISKAASASGLHEVGESVNVGTATIVKRAGHFNNDEWASPKQPEAVFTWSNEKMSSTLTNGAEGYAAQTDVASIAQGTAKTVKGRNRVTIIASADYTAPTNKPITNLNKEYDGEGATWVAGTASSTESIEWTGVYPCFTNIADSTLTENANTKLSLISGNTFDLVDTPSEVVAGRKVRFAYPDGWTIQAFQMKDPSGKWVNVDSAYKPNAGSETKSIQGVNVTYHYLETAGGAGSQTYRITLNKNLNA